MPKRVYGIYTAYGRSTKAFLNMRRATEWAKAEARKSGYDVKIEGPGGRSKWVRATKRSHGLSVNPRRKISGGVLSKLLSSNWKKVQMRVHKGETQIALYGKDAQKILKKLTGKKNPARKRRRK